MRYGSNQVFWTAQTRPTLHDGGHESKDPHHRREVDSRRVGVEP